VVAQRLPKPSVAGSNPVSRSNFLNVLRSAACRLRCIHSLSEFGMFIAPSQSFPGGLASAAFIGKPDGALPGDLNDFDQIAGTFTDATGREHGFLASPIVPEPSTYLLLGSGVLMLGYWKRRIWPRVLPSSHLQWRCGRKRAAMYHSHGSTSQTRKKVAP
jgi:hypothetical protein